MASGSGLAVSVAPRRGVAHRGRRTGTRSPHRANSTELRRRRPGPGHVDQPAGTNTVVTQPDDSIVAGGQYGASNECRSAPNAGSPTDTRRRVLGGRPVQPAVRGRAGRCRRRRAPVRRQDRHGRRVLDVQESDGEFGLLRLATAGVPDATFGTGGEVTTEFAGGDAEAEAVTVLADGTIVAVGDLDPERTEFAIARYDTAARSCGRPPRRSRRVSRAADVVVEANRLVAVGTVDPPSGEARFALAGYTLSGALDATFGNAGTQDTAFVGGAARDAARSSRAPGSPRRRRLHAQRRRAPVRARALHRRRSARHHLPDRGPDDHAFHPGQRVRGRRHPGAVRGLVVGGLAFDFSLGVQVFALAGLWRRRDPQPRLRERGDHRRRRSAPRGSGTAIALAPGDKPVVAGPITGKGNVQFGVARYLGSCPTPPPPPPPPPPPLRHRPRRRRRLRPRPRLRRHRRRRRRHRRARRWPRSTRPPCCCAPTGRSGRAALPDGAHRALRRRPRTHSGAPRTGHRRGATAASSARPGVVLDRARPAREGAPARQPARGAPRAPARRTGARRRRTRQPNGATRVAGARLRVLIAGGGFTGGSPLHRDGSSARLRSPDDAHRGRSRRAHRRRRRCRRRAAPARPRHARCTARRATPSATTGRGRARPPRGRRRRARRQAVVCCWTGTGASIAANKVPGRRAALCPDAATADGARRWNDANVLALFCARPRSRADRDPRRLVRRRAERRRRRPRERRAPGGDRGRARRPTADPRQRVAGEPHESAVSAAPASPRPAPPARPRAAGRGGRAPR